MECSNPEKINIGIKNAIPIGFFVLLYDSTARYIIAPQKNDAAKNQILLRDVETNIIFVWKFVFRSIVEKYVKSATIAVPKMLKIKTTILNPNDDAFGLIYPIDPVKRFRSSILIVISAPANRSTPKTYLSSDGCNVILLNINAAIPIMIPAHKDFKIVFIFSILSTLLN